MPEADDTIGQGRQGGIWLVGLSGGAIGGALAKLDWLLKLPQTAKIEFLIAFIGFLVSIYFGVAYVGQLLPLKQLAQKRKQAEERNPRDPAEVDRLRGQVSAANEKASHFNTLTMLPFLGACIAVALSLGSVLFSPVELEAKPPVPAPPNKYLILNVPVQIHGRVDHSHTLLLNQQTGEVWELTCQNGKAVEFRSVPGTPISKTARQSEEVR